MTVNEARSIIGDRASWELRNMKKALSIMAVLNTPEENRRLEAVKCMLRAAKGKER